MTWRRWLRYGKAKVDSMVRDADAELDRKEAALAAEQADKPWLRPEGDTPTMDDVRARIEDRAAKATAEPPRAPEATSDPDGAQLAVELDAQKKAAEQRLADIRTSLDLPPEGGAKP